MNISTDLVDIGLSCPTISLFNNVDTLKCEIASSCRGICLNMFEYIPQQNKFAAAKTQGESPKLAHLNKACCQIMMIIIDSSIQRRATRLVTDVYISASFNQKTPERGLEVGSPQECRLCVPDGSHLSVYLRPSIEQHGQNERAKCFTKRSKAAIVFQIYIFTANIRVCTILQHQFHSFRIPGINRPYQRIRLHIWWWVT